jgi:hypothetical protein
MSRSTGIAVIIIVILLLVLGNIGHNYYLDRVAAAEQTERDLHIQMVIRARQYTLQGYSVELSDSSKLEALEEFKQWLDSLKTGGVD